jgi:NlpC/P60 family/Putative peptidoglycan binding domain
MTHSRRHFLVFGTSLLIAPGFLLAGTSSASAATPGELAVAAAMTQIGVPYQYGVEKPGVGFDCSGLVQWAWQQAGLTIPRVTTDQAAACGSVKREELQPGDLLFNASFGHVTMWAGDGFVVAADSTGTLVRKRPVRWESVATFRRPGTPPNAGSLTKKPFQFQKPVDKPVPVALPAPRATPSPVPATALPNTVTPSQWSTVAYGSAGGAVAVVQETLTKLGFNVGLADGQFGSRTQRAVREFQAANTLKADGIVGPLTAKALRLTA